MDKNKTEITKEQLDESWDLIRDDIYKNINDQLPDKQAIDRMSIITKDNRGKLKFKKHSKNKCNIKIGDTVNKCNEYGEVIDIDGDLLCVKNRFGDIEIWNIKDVRRM